MREQLTEQQVADIISECKARISSVDELEKLPLPVLPDHWEDREIARIALASLEAPSLSEKVIDWVCLTCVDVRNASGEFEAQDSINEIRAELEKYTTPPVPVLRMPEKKKRLVSEDKFLSAYLPQQPHYTEIFNRGFNAGAQVAKPVERPAKCALYRNVRDSTYSQGYDDGVRDSMAAVRAAGGEVAE
ncbi:MAG: hypothetical protein [Siphoviridae sp. ctdc_1]|nr:MAG: hypothetical protein [Siphoviridae sp. ctdc_1]